MFKRILVPVDGTEPTDQVVDASIDLARQLHASITCFVTEPASPSEAMPRRGFPVIEEAVEHAPETLAKVHRLLRQFDTAARAAGVACDAVFEHGSRSDRALVAAAESCGCDLMLMVTTGRGVFGEALFGSQTKAVLAGCKLPMLLLLPQ
jgi:nucleotide-binding universal stress UspA family protein